MPTAWVAILCGATDGATDASLSVLVGAGKRVGPTATSATRLWNEVALRATTATGTIDATTATTATNLLPVTAW